MRKKPQQSKARKLMGGIGYSVFLLSALLVGSAAGWLAQSPILVKLAFNPPDPQKVFHSDSETVLILGCDEDLQDNTEKVLKKQARSDMMLIARLDFKNKEITGVSIPRDTECRMPTHKDLIVGYLRKYNIWKINAYHEIASKGHEAELTEDAVEYLLPGVHIDRVITLDFDAFQSVVNLVDGVPIYVDKNLDYDDKAGNLHIHIKKGSQVLNGYNAMCYVRFRHGDDDLQRQARQKKFLMAFKGQLMHEITKLNSVVNEAVNVLGGSMNNDEIASLVSFARSVPPQKINWGQVPVTSRRGSGNLFLDKKNLQTTLVQYKLVPPSPITTASATSGGDQ